MRTIVFYSYKGGVGRTLAAANFAVYLASKLNQKTVIIDFDLEAPGIDSKFPLLELSENQKGVLDYILEYQQTNTDPGSLQPFYTSIPVNAEKNEIPLYIIPAGDYLSPSYYQKLSQLDWGLIFSEKRNGVEFFQQLLARIEEEIGADFVVVDSRTGITEIAGLCTQQLADEVVMLSSLSSESIKVTKHIKDLINNSSIARSLEKNIEVKIVVSRVPKPDKLVEFKEKCCNIFEIDEAHLFFLFSCPNLEIDEFIAILETEKEPELLDSYIKLFYGLNLEFADRDIIHEIEQFSTQILRLSPAESEKRILELVTLYPHPEVYRAAMNFFAFTKNASEMVKYGLKLIDVLPNDEEAYILLGKYYLSKIEDFLYDLEDIYFDPEGNPIDHPINNKKFNFLFRNNNVVKVLSYLYTNNKLVIADILVYIKYLINYKKYQDAYTILVDLVKPGNFSPLSSQEIAEAKRMAIYVSQELQKMQIDVPHGTSLFASIKEEDIDSDLDDIPF